MCSRAAAQAQPAQGEPCTPTKDEHCLEKLAAISYPASTGCLVLSQKEGAMQITPAGTA